METSLPSTCRQSKPAGGCCGRGGLIVVTAACGDEHRQYDQEGSPSSVGTESFHFFSPICWEVKTDSGIVFPDGLHLGSCSKTFVIFTGSSQSFPDLKADLTMALSQTAIVSATLSPWSLLPTKTDSSVALRIVRTSSRGVAWSIPIRGFETQNICCSVLLRTI